MRLVSDEAVEAALTYLATASEATAAARGMRVRAEFTRKRVRARLILDSEEKSLGLREADAEASEQYARVCEAEAKAVEADEWHRSERNRADTVLEAYRTQEATLRAGASFR